jgi:hypothetical protein
MRHFSLAILVVRLGWSSFLAAQTTALVASTASADNPPLILFSDRLAPAAIPATPPTAPAVLPSMSSELALRAYWQRVQEQDRNLASYSATTVICAELPTTSQYGEYELRRDYSAPRTLGFKVFRSVGDIFVRSKVIARLL